MKHLRKFNENNNDFNVNVNVATKVSELQDELNDIKDLDVTIQYEEDGNSIVLKVELLLNNNLKKLTPETLTIILDKFNGYIENINYDEKTNKIIIMFRTFENKL